MVSSWGKKNKSFFSYSSFSSSIINEKSRDVAANAQKVVQLNDTVAMSSGRDSVIYKMTSTPLFLT